jgi:hypothetical protein
MFQQLGSTGTSTSINAGNILLLMRVKYSHTPILPLSDEALLEVKLIYCHSVIGLGYAIIAYRNWKVQFVYKFVQ